MKQKLIGYLLLIGGLICFVFFNNYRGNLIEHTTAFWFISLLIFVIGFFILKNARSDKEVKMISDQQRMIHELLDTGNRVKVDLTKCEIKSNSFVDTEMETDSDDVSFIKYFADPGILGQLSTINLIFSDPNYRSANQFKEFSILFYKTNYLGAERIFISPLIQKDNLTLSVLLDVRKETTLYISKEDKQKYYFDLGFLNE